MLPRHARPKIPTPGIVPLSARIATLSLTLLGAYVVFAGLTGIDTERRLLLVLLSGSSLPAWALFGVIAGAAAAALGLVVGRRLLRAARQVADQDPRGSAALAIPAALVIAAHALLVTGPLLPWSPAAPIAGGSFLGIELLGDAAVLGVPVVVLLAVLATVARRRATGWLNALPD
jgi:hypothetical protein